MYEERIKLLALLVQNKLAEPARNILDVGAHSGDWTRTMSTLFQDAKFLMILKQTLRRLKRFQLIRHNLVTSLK
jgi:23S rRNA U2552 (ribose-2'-O)-methylase RlmE/FtsJ